MCPTKEKKIKEHINLEFSKGILPGDPFALSIYLSI